MCYPRSRYTVGFAEWESRGEGSYAGMGAKNYVPEHHENTSSAGQFAEFLPNYIWHMEEPVCEPPAVALYYVSKLAKDFVKVLISGEGGDEAFAGYSNYRTRLWFERLKRFPAPLRQLFSASFSMLTRFVSPGMAEKSAKLLHPRLEDSYYSRTSDPSRFFNNQCQQFHSSDF